MRVLNRTKLLFVLMLSLAVFFSGPADGAEPETPVPAGTMKKQFEELSAESALAGFFEYRLGDAFAGGHGFEKKEQERVSIGEIPGLERNLTPAMLETILKQTHGAYVYDQQHGLHMPLQKYHKQVGIAGNGGAVYSYDLWLSTDNLGRIVAYNAHRLHDSFAPVWPLIEKLNALVEENKLNQNWSTYFDASTQITLIVNGGQLRAYRYINADLIEAVAVAQGRQDSQEQRARDEAARKKAAAAEAEARQKQAVAEARVKYKNTDPLTWIGSLTQAEFKAVKSGFHPAPGIKMLLWGPDLAEYEFEPTGATTLHYAYAAVDEIVAATFGADDKLAVLRMQLSDARAEATAVSIKNNHRGSSKDFKLSKNAYDVNRGTRDLEYEYTVTRGESGERVYILLQTKNVKNILYIYEKGFYEQMLAQAKAAKKKQDQEKAGLVEPVI